MKKWKPSQVQCDLIKKAAAREASIEVGVVLLEPGFRWGDAHPERGSTLNVLLVTDDPQWSDTDLADYGAWRDFRAGVPLTEDGRAAVDFYIRRRFDQYGELLGNVTVYFENGAIRRIQGYGTPTPEYPIM